LSLGAVSVASAEARRYVSDELTIAVRSGQSFQHKILRFLPSGTVVTELEVNPESGYSRVRMPDGEEGWARSEELSSEPGARARLEQALERMQTLREERAEARAQAESLSGELAALREVELGLREELGEVGRSLETLRETAAEPLRLAEQNRALQAEVGELTERVRVLQTENAGLRDRSLKEWFALGAGILVVGLALGLVLPMIPWRRRRWDFH
jgi:SH3 domain protein